MTTSDSPVGIQWKPARRFRLPVLLVLTCLLHFSHPVSAQEVGPGTAGTEEERRSALDALMASDREHRYEDTLRLSEECLRWLEDPTWRVYAVRAAAWAEYKQERWDACLARFPALDRELAAIDGKHPNLESERSHRDGIHAMALLGAGRRQESVMEFGEAMARHPTLRQNIEVRIAQAVALAEGDFTVDPDYRGKYVDDERLPAVYRDLRASLPRAVARLAARLGVKEPGLPPVVVVLGDASSFRREGTGLLMECRLTKVGPEAVAVILATAEPLMAGTVDMETCLAHELVHALHGGAAAAEDAPPWVVEGLAHWLARSGEGDLEEKVLLYATTQYTKSEGRPLEGDTRIPLSGALGTRQGIEGLDEDGKRIAGTLLFRHLERSLGMVAFRKLASRLLSEREALPPLKEATGKSLDELLPEVRDGYKAWVEEVFAGRSALDGAMAAASGGDLDRALELADAYLERAGESVLVPVALNWRILHLMYAMKRPTEAILASGEFLRRYPRHPWATQVRVLEARALLNAGDRASAGSRARILLRDFAWCSPGIEKEAKELLARAEEPVPPAPKGDSPAGSPPTGGTEK